MAETRHFRPPHTPIDNHATVRQQWAETLAERGELPLTEAEAMQTQMHTDLQELYESLAAEEVADALEPQLESPPSGAGAASGNGRFPANLARPQSELTQPAR